WVWVAWALGASEADPGVRPGCAGCAPERLLLQQRFWTSPGPGTFQVAGPFSCALAVAAQPRGPVCFEQNPRFSCKRHGYPAKRAFLGCDWLGSVDGENGRIENGRKDALRPAGTRKGEEPRGSLTPLKGL